MLVVIGGMLLLEVAGCGEVVEVTVTLVLVVEAVDGPDVPATEPPTTRMSAQFRNSSKPGPTEGSGALAPLRSGENALKSGHLLSEQAQPQKLKRLHPKLSKRLK